MKSIQKWYDNSMKKLKIINTFETYNHQEDLLSDVAMDHAQLLLDYQPSDQPPVGDVKMRQLSVPPGTRLRDASRS